MNVIYGTDSNWLSKAVISPWLFRWVCLLALICFQTALLGAEPLKLKTVDFSSLPGDQLEFHLELSGPAIAPRVFHTENPARISIDLPGVVNALDHKTIPVNVGVASRVQALQASGRTRVVLSLLRMVPYTTRVEGNTVYIALNDKADLAATAKTSPIPRQMLKNIDFRRGTQGEGRILIELSNPNTVVDMREKGGKVELSFLNTGLPPELAKKLDVIDFATPVKTIETRADGNRVKMTVTPAIKDYDYLSYQMDGVMTLEFRSLTRAEKEVLKKNRFEYSGDRLSLNFQDIDVRAVLQILADFTNLNIVASDTVNGSITLRLNDVPWDQALDLILKSKGLAKRHVGNVVLVAPSVEINKIEKEELEALAVREELEPMRTELIQINYAKAAEIQKVLIGVQDKADKAKDVPQDYTGYITDQENGGDSGLNRGSILSARGVVNIDERTNILIVKDTARNLEAVRKLVAELDKPVRQVLIESRVVIANDDFTRELGVRFGGSKDFKPNDPARDIVLSGGSTDDLIVDLPAAVGPGVGGAASFTMFKVGEYLLELELSALQNEGRGEIVSTPRVVTSDQTKAQIEQGVEIPFQTTSQDGTKTEFKKAVLKLEVTPQITPDDNVVMELLIQKDAPRLNELTPDGVPFDKREIQTTVQVDNGETIVLGGVFEGTQSYTINKVPFFGDLPLVGFLFRKTNNVNDKSELLIFITPKILKRTLNP